MTNDPTSSAATSLAVLRARLATLSGREKRDLLLDAPDPGGLVRSLPAEDLYFAVRDIGLADAVELIQLASPSQFRSFVDLDAWEGDLPDASRALLWLGLALEGAAGPEDFRRKRAALDVELVVLLLKTQTVVHPLEEGVDPVITSDNWLRTAEGKYLVEITSEGDDGLIVRRLLEDFIDENPFEATRLFEAVRWEMQSELEENCKRWRDGRVRELGFPDFDEAIRLWQPLPPGWTPPAAPSDAGRLAGVPVLLAMRGPEVLFLDAAAERLEGDALGRFNEGLVYLLNCALVADGLQPRDFELARGSVAAARAQLSLGLELAAQGDALRAAGLLATTPAVMLFRVAVTALLAVQREADRASRALSFPGTTTTLLDSPEAEKLAGLRRRRPRLYDPPPPGAPKRDAWRALHSRQDLAEARLTVERAVSAGALLSALDTPSEAIVAAAESAGRAPTAVSLSQLVLGRLVRELVGEPAGIVVPVSRLGAVRALFTEGRLKPDARGRLDAVASALVAGLAAEHREHARTLVASWLRRLEEELGAPAGAGPLDVRFIDVFLVAAT
ncbi:MAG: hypothetical protein RL199_747 [Pseudomonadota bacterium]|jgi:hypothetical protein